MVKIHPTGILKERAENVIRRKDAPVKSHGKIYYHVGDYQYKSSAASVKNELHKLGYNAFISDPYHGDLNTSLKYGVYVRRK